MAAHPPSPFLSSLHHQGVAGMCPTCSKVRDDCWHVLRPESEHGVFLSFDFLKHTPSGAEHLSQSAPSLLNRGSSTVDKCHAALQVNLATMTVPYSIHGLQQMLHPPLDPPAQHHAPSTARVTCHGLLKLYLATMTVAYAFCGLWLMNTLPCNPPHPRPSSTCSNSCSLLTDATLRCRSIWPP